MQQPSKHCCLSLYLTKATNNVTGTNLLASAGGCDTHGSDNSQPLSLTKYMLYQSKKDLLFGCIEASNAAFTSNFLHLPLCSTQAAAQQLARGVGKRLHASTKRSSHRLLNKGLIQSLLKRTGESSFLRFGPVGSWLSQGCQALPLRSRDAPRALCHSALLLVLPAHTLSQCSHAKLPCLLPI